MISEFETLPNELFIHEIFIYLSWIDINYGFHLLNQRFHRLVTLFLTKTQHNIHLTRTISSHAITFAIESILPSFNDNYQLKTIELTYVDPFLKFLDNANRINTNYLNMIIVAPFIDIRFKSLINLLCQCPQLNEIKLNVMTNLDSSWTDGRKWIRWFETMRLNNRQNILKSLNICVWCLHPNEVINFDAKLWNRDGVYRDYQSWKVQLKPDQDLNWRQSRRSIEYSRNDHENLILFQNKQTSTCLLM